MAEEQSQENKSLEPTARRLEKAREEGQFATSRDLTTLVLLLVAFLFIFTSGPLLVQQMVAMMREGHGPVDIRLFSWAYWATSPFNHPFITGLCIRSLESLWL